jgi:DNA-binding response OmpR family regulator
MAGKRLLVVDDDPEFGEFVRKVALQATYQVEVVTDGNAFKRCHEKFKPTIVVLDIVMPGVDGIELVQWLAERKSTVHLIIASGYAPMYADLARKMAQAKGLRSVTSLPKPVTPTELRAALAGSLGR